MRRHFPAIYEGSKVWESSRIRVKSQGLNSSSFYPTGIREAKEKIMVTIQAPAVRSRSCQKLQKQHRWLQLSGFRA